MSTLEKIRPAFAIAAAAIFIVSTSLPSSCGAEDFWIRKGSGSAVRPIGSTSTKKKPKTKTTLRTKINQPAGSSSKPAGSSTKPSAAQSPKLLTSGSSDKNAADSMPNKATQSAAPIATDVAKAATAKATIGEPYTPTFGSPVKRRWRVGVVIKTGSQPIADVLNYIPIPQPWPEQEVQVFKDEVPGNFEVQEVEQLKGLQRLVLHGRSIEAKQTVVALMTYTVTTKSVNAPSDTSIFKLPDHKDKAVKDFLMTSEGINFRNKKLRKQAEDLAADADNDWGKAQAIYEWVRANVNLLPEVKNARYLGAQAAFVKREGFNDDVVALFVAMCRSARIPARMVFHNSGSSAEFMLDDAAGNHHWFPCEVVGLEAFGKTVEPHLILQKGDSIKVPGEKGRRRFVPATGICKGRTGTVSPRAMVFPREERPLEDN